MFATIRRSSWHVRPERMSGQAGRRTSGCRTIPLDNAEQAQGQRHRGEGFLHPECRLDFWR